MPSFMLTVVAQDVGGRDVQVDGASDIREAMALAESVTGCRVDHGGGGAGWVASDYQHWHPSISIDAESGLVVHHHDTPATISMTIARPAAARAMATALAQAVPPPDTDD